MTLAGTGGSESDPAAPAVRRRRTPAERRWERAFRETGRRRVRGGHKTNPAEEITFEGRLGRRAFVLRTQPRTDHPWATFLTPSNARIHYGMRSRVPADDQFVDVAVVAPMDVSDDELARIAELAQAVDTRPVVVRRAADPVRTGVQAPVRLRPEGPPEWRARPVEVMVAPDRAPESVPGTAYGALGVARLPGGSRIGSDRGDWYVVPPGGRPLARFERRRDARAFAQAALPLADWDAFRDVSPRDTPLARDGRPLHMVLAQLKGAVERNALETWDTDQAAMGRALEAAGTLAHGGMLPEGLVRAGAHWLLLGPAALAAAGAMRGHGREGALAADDFTRVARVGTPALIGPQAMPVLVLTQEQAAEVEARLLNLGTPLPRHELRDGVIAPLPPTMPETVALTIGGSPVLADVDRPRGLVTFRPDGAHRFAFFDPWDGSTPTAWSMADPTAFAVTRDAAAVADMTAAGAPVRFPVSVDTPAGPVTLEARFTPSGFRWSRSDLELRPDPAGPAPIAGLRPHLGPGDRVQRGSALEALAGRKAQEAAYSFAAEAKRTLNRTARAAGKRFDDELRTSWRGASFLRGQRTAAVQAALAIPGSALGRDLLKAAAKLQLRLEKAAVPESDDPVERLRGAFSKALPRRPALAAAAETRALFAMRTGIRSALSEEDKAVVDAARRVLKGKGRPREAAPADPPVPPGAGAQYSLGAPPLAPDTDRQWIGTHFFVDYRPGVVLPGTADLVELRAHTAPRIVVQPVDRAMRAMPDGGWDEIAGLRYTAELDGATHQVIALPEATLASTEFDRVWNHELVHAFRHGGYLEDREWDALVREPHNARWVDALAVRHRYPGLGPAQLAEEAVCDAYGWWARGGLTGQLAPPADAEAVFRSIADGTVGHRQPEWQIARRFLRRFGAVPHGQFATDISYKAAPPAALPGEPVPPGGTAGLPSAGILGEAEALGDRPAWELSRAEYIVARQRDLPPTDPRRIDLEAIRPLLRDHAAAVFRAVAEGKPVPDKALEGHPTLVVMQAAANAVAPADRAQPVNPAGGTSWEAADATLAVPGPAGWQSVGARVERRGPFAVHRAVELVPAAWSFRGPERSADDLRAVAADLRRQAEAGDHFDRRTRLQDAEAVSFVASRMEGGEPFAAAAAAGLTGARDRFVRKALADTLGGTAIPVAEPRTKAGWQITHLPTGLPLIGKAQAIATRADARRVVEVLAGTWPWGEVTFGRLPELVRRADYREAYDRWGAAGATLVAVVQARRAVRRARKEVEKAQAGLDQAQAALAVAEERREALLGAGPAAPAATPAQAPPAPATAAFSLGDAHARSRAPAPESGVFNAAEPGYSMERLRGRDAAAGAGRTILQETPAMADVASAQSAYPNSPFPLSAPEQRAAFAAVAEEAADRDLLPIARVPGEDGWRFAMGESANQLRGAAAQAGIALDDRGADGVAVRTEDLGTLQPLLPMALGEAALEAVADRPRLNPFMLAGAAALGAAAVAAARDPDAMRRALGLPDAEGSGLVQDVGQRLSELQQGAASLTQSLSEARAAVATALSTGGDGPMSGAPVDAVSDAAGQGVVDRIVEAGHAAMERAGALLDTLGDVQFSTGRAPADAVPSPSQAGLAAAGDGIQRALLASGAATAVMAAAAAARDTLAAHVPTLAELAGSVPAVQFSAGAPVAEGAEQAGSHLGSELSAAEALAKLAAAADALMPGVPFTGEAERATAAETAFDDALMAVRMAAADERRPPEQQDALLRVQEAGEHLAAAYYAGRGDEVIGKAGLGGELGERIVDALGVVVDSATATADAVIDRVEAQRLAASVDPAGIQAVLVGPDGAVVSRPAEPAPTPDAASGPERGRGERLTDRLRAAAATVQDGVQHITSAALGAAGAVKDAVQQPVPLGKALAAAAASTAAGVAAGTGAALHATGQLPPVAFKAGDDKAFATAAGAGDRLQPFFARPDEAGRADAVLRAQGLTAEDLANRLTVTRALLARREKDPKASPAETAALKAGADVLTAESTRRVQAATRAPRRGRGQGMG